ncbi:MAG: NAD(P)H-dependent oxidoreductase subunit E [Deltaproteobacteria bacterium]|nr:NAD(P)H-dependent oxidoreductase subunit E [Deltaproteobacteria bacterium]
MTAARAEGNAKLAALIARHPAGDATDLVQLLQDIQEEFNYLPEDAIHAAAAHVCVPVTKAFSVATFYRAFSLKPRGKTIIKVCLGTTCHIRGAPVVVDDIRTGLGVGPGETTKDMAFTVEVVNCVGACALAPVVIAGSRYLANVKPGTITRLLGAK